jgi:hypothetical protein
MTVNIVFQPYLYASAYLLEVLCINFNNRFGKEYLTKDIS